MEPGLERPVSLGTQGAGLAHRAPWALIPHPVVGRRGPWEGREPGGGHAPSLRWKTQGPGEGSTDHSTLHTRPLVAPQLWGTQGPWGHRARGLQSWGTVDGLLHPKHPLGLFHPQSAFQPGPWRPCPQSPVAWAIACGCRPRQVGDTRQDRPQGSDACSLLADCGLGQIAAPL